MRRRSFLADSARAATAAGLAGILAGHRAPAHAREIRLHVIRQADVVPEADVVLEQQMREAGRSLGAEIVLEFVRAGGLQARVAAAVQPGAVADVVQLPWNWAHRYAATLLEVDDVAESIATAQRGVHDVFGATARVAGRWLAVPHALRTTAVAYRKSWYAEVGVDQFPPTWDEWLTAGRRLKGRGRPIGQALRPGPGDAAAFAYPLLWDFGGLEIDAGGAVAIESKQTVEAVKFMRAFWTEACDESGTAWDDSDNDEAFLAGLISATLNGAHFRVDARRRRASVAADIHCAPLLPTGPGGQTALHQPWHHAIPHGSRHPDLAKGFLSWLHAGENYGPWLEAQAGTCAGPTRQWEDDALWNRVDPPMRALRRAGRAARMPGHPGPASLRAGESHTRGVVVQMFARAVHGQRAEDAVKWASSELRAIHQGSGR